MLSRVLADCWRGQLKVSAWWWCTVLKERVKCKLNAYCQHENDFSWYVSLSFPNENLILWISAQFSSQCISEGVQSSVCEIDWFEKYRNPLFRMYSCLLYVKNVAKVMEILLHVRNENMSTEWCFKNMMEMYKKREKRSEEGILIAHTRFPAQMLSDEETISLQPDWVQKTTCTIRFAQNYMLNSRIRLMKTTISAHARIMHFSATPFASFISVKTWSFSAEISHPNAHSHYLCRSACILLCMYSTRKRLILHSQVNYSIVSIHIMYSP